MRGDNNSGKEFANNSLRERIDGNLPLKSPFGEQTLVRKCTT